MVVNQKSSGVQTEDQSSASTTTPLKTPIVYLGKSFKEELYYFLSIKNGEGRFLRFGFAPFYPFWVGGVNTGTSHTVPDRLLLTDCPEGVLEEVSLFIQGKIRYEFEPSRKGRKATVRKITVVDAEGAEDGGVEIIPSPSNGSSNSGANLSADNTGRVPSGRSANAESKAAYEKGRTSRSGKGRLGGADVSNSRPRKHLETKAGELSSRGNLGDKVVPVVPPQPAVKEVKKVIEVIVPKQKQPEIDLAQHVEVPKRRRGRPVGSTNKAKLLNPKSGEVVIGTKSLKKTKKHT